MFTARDTIAPIVSASQGAKVSAFCQELLSPLARSDQRRWGEVYVRGLVTVPGRKSIRRIADQAVGRRADQSLQQFVNQSPWSWERVRRNLAEYVTDLAPPRAWVVREAVFPKNGSSSVGVARQYVPAASRTLNCQLGLAVFLAGDSAACPVNWRLLLPRSWDDDRRRRERVYLPSAQRYRPRWLHLLDAVDEMALRWRLPPVPVVVDAVDHRDAEALLRGLEERRRSYLVQVAPHMPLPVSPGRGRTRTGRDATVGEVALHWPATTEMRLATARFAATAMPGEGGPARKLLAQWAAERDRLHATWLTNLDVARLPELIRLVTMRGRAAEHLTRMEDEVGLRHFEGRSYRGWHHHTTLASVAHAYRLTKEVR